MATRRTFLAASAAAPLAYMALRDKPAPTPEACPPPVLASTVYHGVTNHPAPWDMKALDAFETNAGKRVAVLSYFVGFVNNAHEPERDRLEAVRAHGAVPMITWQWGQLSSLSDVLQGKYDGGAVTWARVLKAYGGPVFLRWGHEMNLPNYRWSVGVSGNTAQQYVAAWRRLKGIFAAEGAGNVMWVWCPNVRGGTALDFVPMYPGDAYVDWLGLDGYNWGAPWRSLTQTFADSYAAISALSQKPLMIAEYGCVEQGGDKGAWLRSALSSDIPSLPRIKAAVYFNQNFERDWRIESSIAARSGYAAGVASNVYQAVWP